MVLSLPLVSEMRRKKKCIHARALAMSVSVRELRALRSFRPQGHPSVLTGGALTSAKR